MHRCWIILLVLLCFVISVKSQTTDLDRECPVCLRVLRAAKDFGKSRGMKVSEALNLYCTLKEIEVEDQKFCYNTDNVRTNLNKLLDLGADESRVCKKVSAINPDFCKVMTKKVGLDGIHKNDRLIRGIIYI